MDLANFFIRNTEQADRRPWHCADTRRTVRLLPLVSAQQIDRTAAEQPAHRGYHDPRAHQDDERRDRHAQGGGQVEPQHGVVAQTHEEVVYHVDAEAAGREVGQQRRRARTGLHGHEACQQIPAHGHHGHVGRVVGVEELYHLGSLFGQGEHVFIAREGDGEARGHQHDGEDEGRGRPRVHVVAEVMAEQHIAAETGEIVEESEGVPLARAEGVAAHELGEVRQEGAQGPQGEHYLLLPPRSALHPGREDGQVEIEPHEHIDVPHVAGDEVEGIGNADHVGQTVGKGLAVGNGPREEVEHDALVKAHETREPRREIVDHRPDEEGPQHTRQALAVEGLHGLAHRQREYAREHHEERHAGPHQRAPAGAPYRKFRVGDGAGRAVGGGGIEGVGGMAAEQQNEGKQAHDIAPYEAFLRHNNNFLGWILDSDARGTKARKAAGAAKIHKTYDIRRYAGVIRHRPEPNAELTESR